MNLSPAIFALAQQTLEYAHEHNHGFEPWPLFLHALADTAKMLPFLFAAYLVIEYIEQRHSERIESVLAKGGRFGFVPGAVLGLLPQCGFSAMAANFYASRVVTLGTVLAVFLATSDEALPILLAYNGYWPNKLAVILLLLGVKLVWAMFAGFFVDFVLARLLPAGLRGGYRGSAAEVDCHEKHEHGGILVSALKHTLQIFLIVLAFTYLFSLLTAWLGQQRVGQFMDGMGLLQPAVAALFGLIPNCASSVFLTNLYLSGAISFGSLVAGLSVNAGVGLTVLFRTNRPMKQNFFLLGLLYVLGVVPGVLLMLVGL